MAKTVTKKSNKTERIKDDYVTDIEGIESYETEKKQSGYQIKTKAAIDDVIFKDLREGNVSGISDNLQALIHDASPDDLVKLKNLFANHALANQVRTGSRKDDELSDDWRKGGYPYKNRLSRKNYEKQKYHLQVELLKLQSWVRETGQKVVIVFEGRDAAGRGSAQWREGNLRGVSCSAARQCVHRVAPRTQKSPSHGVTAGSGTSRAKAKPRR